MIILLATVLQDLGSSEKAKLQYCGWYGLSVFCMIFKQGFLGNYACFKQGIAWKIICHCNTVGFRHFKHQKLVDCVQNDLFFICPILFFMHHGVITRLKIGRRMLLRLFPFSI
jgi:hypothetical protein